MEDRLKSLHKSMKNSTFGQLEFTEQMQKEIRQKITKQIESEETILLSIMQLLIEEKTGYELAKLLRGRGIQTFEGQEGYLYIDLHQLEQADCLAIRWDGNGEKYYQLSNAGKKKLRKAEKRLGQNQPFLKELLGW